MTTINFKWMIGRGIGQILIIEPQAWAFQFDGGGSVVVECSWRILKDGRVAVSSEDHMQQYGLSTPVDARQSAAALLAANRVVDVQAQSGTADLIITLDQKIQLQVVPISSGYESWQLNDPHGNSIIAQGGGQLVSLKK